MFDSNSGLTSSFGWEGDVHAPIAYIDGSYKLRDRSGTMVTFGVRDIPGKIKWYNKEGYLPCFVSEYSKDGMDITVENFANKHIIDGNAFEVAYSRMTVKNTSEEEITVDFTGDELSVPYSIELIAMKNNIASVTVDGTKLAKGINQAAGTAAAGKAANTGLSTAARSTIIILPILIAILGGGFFFIRKRNKQ